MGSSSSLPEKSCSMLCLGGISPDSEQGHPEHKDPLVPNRAFICSFYQPFQIQVLLQSCLLLLWVLWTNLGTCSSHQDCLCLFQLVYFCFVDPCQEEGACGALELCPKKLLNTRHLVSCGCLGKALLRGSMAQAGHLQAFHPALEHAVTCGQEIIPQQLLQGSNPARAALSITVPAPRYFTSHWRAKGWCLATSFLVHKQVSSGGWHLAVLCWSRRSKMMVSVQLPKHHTRDESALSCKWIYGSESWCTAILLRLQCGPLGGSYRHPPGLYHPHTSVSQACFAMDSLKNRLEPTTTMFWLTESSLLVTTEQELSFSSLKVKPQPPRADHQRHYWRSANLCLHDMVCTCTDAGPASKGFLLPLLAVTAAKPFWYKLGELGAVLPCAGAGWWERVVSKVGFPLPTYMENI